ncbi:MAG: hypothetical protein HQL23_00195 [Candidatus Omnitrophica bacterium]|nr:hypothetical protein [Candidatus Omnitrophota bacterium]
MQVLPLVLVLNDICLGYNVGSIFRAGVEKIYLRGVTGYPPNQLFPKLALSTE